MCDVKKYTYHLKSCKLGPATSIRFSWQCSTSFGLMLPLHIVLSFFPFFRVWNSDWANLQKLLRRTVPQTLFPFIRYINRVTGSICSNSAELSVGGFQQLRKDERAPSAITTLFLLDWSWRQSSSFSRLQTNRAMTSWKDLEKKKQVKCDHRARYERASPCL